MNRIARLSLLLALLAASGCGQPGTQHSPVISSASLPVLATSAVPGIPSATTRLTAAELAKDAAIRGLAGKIASWGYLGGRQRTFQGESHCRWRHARRPRRPKKWVGVTRMKCAGTPSIHGSSPALMNGALRLAPPAG